MHFTLVGDFNQQSFKNHTKTQRHFVVCVCVYVWTKDKLDKNLDSVA